jgi:holo-[acyl-carrier protein] synthase
LIYGLGTDLIEIPRVERALARFGVRFAERILCEPELRRFRAHARPASYLAKRFAAKEAFSKAIGTGFHAPFRWHAISVGRDARGKPGLVPSDDMARHLASIGVTASHISLTDDAGIAVAFVVLEG